jgi:parvulin-like peptidyl-prolyl isomerase
MLNKIFLFLVIIFIPLYPQQEGRVVAKVGNYKIYESEFKERFDFSAHPRLLQSKDQQLAKHEFLKQLIAEKLLSLEAQEKGLGQSEIFSNIITPLENMFVRDALYNMEIKNKCSYSQEEINEGVDRISKVLKVKFLFSKNWDELEEIHRHLKTGASFDSLLFSRIESKDQDLPKEITFGTMDKDVEDIVYELNPGEFTNPIESEDGYYILKLIDVEKNPALKDREMLLEDVKRIVETRAEYRRYVEYYRNFFSEHRVTADKEIFENLIKIFVPRFNEKYFNNKSLYPDSPPEGKEIKSPLPLGEGWGEGKATHKYFLRGDEVSSALQIVNSNLQNKIFIKLSDKPIKVKYFLNQLSLDGFFVRDISELSIRASLSAYIRKFIEDELLTITGKEKGLENSPGIKKYLSMWEDSYLSKMLMVNIFDSLKVTEEEVHLIYQDNNGRGFHLEFVNIAEVLSDSLSVIETVLNGLRNGADIKELAKKYTKRDSLRSKGGEFGFFPVTRHGEIGKIASQMNIGDIYGPIKLDEGYSVFQLIDRKEDTTGYSLSYDDIKDQIVMQLTLNKFEKYINEYNAKLAVKYGVEINEDVLNDINNIFMNLVVVRYMGFGGEIFAVPYTEQFSGWYEIWQKKQEVVP